MIIQCYKKYSLCLYFVKVCGNDYLRRSVQSGHMVAERGVKPLSTIICLMKWDALQLPHMVAECGVKPLSTIICLMKWDALQLPILSPNIL